MIIRPHQKSPGVDRVINGKVYRLPSQDSIKKSAMLSQSQSTQVQPSSSNGLCFWLGLVLGPFGLLLSAIVGKADGLIASIKGLAVSCLIALLVVLLLCVH